MPHFLHPPDKKRPKLVNALIEMFGFSPWFATVVALFLVMLAAGALVWLWLSAPPRTLTITSGPPGSSFERYAKAYQQELAKSQITLNILPSGGSLENLNRLQSSDSAVDIGFVQDGLVGDQPPPDLVSLGSISYQPLWLFYRGSARMVRLSELAGKRVGVGEKGSGTYSLATDLLTRNGVTATTATFAEDDSADAASALVAGKLDAIFLMGDSASIDTLRTLTRNAEVQLYHYTQADAYIRRVPQLNKIILPQGALDFARNIPPQDVALVGPAVELVARKGLHSALSDHLLEAARLVHNRAGLLSRRGEFPAPLERDFNLSDDALRFYKSGKGFTYRFFPYHVASLINRILVAIVPMLLLLIPAIRLLPIAYRWSVQLRIYRCYRPLLRLEREAKGPLEKEAARDLMEWLDEIEQEVNALKVPASFAYQYYALRGHVAFVRKRLSAAVATT